LPLLKFQPSYFKRQLLLRESK